MFVMRQVRTNFVINYHKLYSLGEAWIDQSMEDWPENDFRIFCGNLGNEVTDEILSLAFRRYPSFNRAKVFY